MNIGMRRLYYYVEKTMYIHILLILLFSSILFYVLYRSEYQVDNTILAIAVLSVILNSYKALDGIILLYKKRICTLKGQQYEGKLVGKIGTSAFREGYFYKLVITYEKGKIITPLVQTKYVDSLKNKKCIVNVYGNNVYVCGYSLCKKGDSPVKIRIVGNKTNMLCEMLPFCKG